MTASLATVGVCYLVTAIGLSKVNALGRAVFGFAGVATVVVAALPQPTIGHVPAAGIAFVALALWPAVSGAPTRAVAVDITVLLVSCSAGAARNSPAAGSVSATCGGAVRIVAAGLAPG